MGHSVPSARRMPAQTAAWSRAVMNPVSGEKPPSSQQLEVAELAEREVVGRPVARRGGEVGGAVRRGEQINEGPAVGGDEMGRQRRDSSSRSAR